MRKSMMQRTGLREIRSTLGRYLAILGIVALGVGFFSGVRITTPAMVHTVNNFWADKELFDFRLVSTLGWEEDDVQAFQAADGVRSAEGSNTVDILCKGHDGTELVLKAHSLPEQVNLLELVEGRMPEAENECIMDAGLPAGFSVGDTICVSESNEEDTLGALRFREFVIVGAAHSSFYLNFERGTTSIGNGSVSGYLYIRPEAFDRDYYTDIYVRLDQDEVIYAKTYKDLISTKTPQWETIASDQAEARYDRIVAEAQQEIDDGRRELEDKRAEGQQELDDAQKELHDGQQELEDARQELLDAQQELSDGKGELDDAKSGLDKAGREISDGQRQLEASRQQLDEAKAQLEDSEAQLSDGQAQLTAGQAQLDAAAAELAAGEEQLAAAQAQLDAQEAALNDQLTQLAPLWDALPEEQKAQLTAAREQIAAGKQTLAVQSEQLAQGRQSLEAQQALLDEKQAELESGLAALAQGKAEYEAGLAQYEAALKKWGQGKAQYQSGLRQYQDGLAEYEDGVRQYEDGCQEYEDGLRKIEDGRKEYEDGKREFDEKIADAESELADAEAELADLAHPEVFVLDRNTNVGYACFESDSQIVEQVAKVFPLFFILVAALVCMTTMSRMVEEQRTQIGVFKALGYSEGTIMGKFMFYAGSAAVIGCVSGYAIGSVLFPSVIWMSYELMYIPLPLEYVFDWKLALLALGASLLCSIGTTWISCRVELNETAASLMRPKAPKAGKRVFLEYVPFIWNRLKFLHKVSIRNIFRYKRRFFMMITGIGGCTALLLTGFGIKDSVAGFADVQYNEILIADATATLKNETPEVTAALREQLEAVGAAWLPTYHGAWDLVTEKVKSMDLIVPFETEQFGDFMTLRSMDGEPLAFPETGAAVVSNSVAERYGVKTGDTITLRNEDMEELHLRVSGVFENHVYNYVVFSAETMAEQTGELPFCNFLYLNFPEGADEHQLASEIGSGEDITVVTLLSELKERLSKMMSSLDYVVLLIIFCAAGLAFIVLYNLTNINITERIREIATIKVLGFFRNETSNYVLRENLALTALGTLLGLGLGVLLHRFVIRQIVVDLVSFRIQILPMSFVYSIALTFVFNCIVNLFMGRKLDRINMAESLKSVD